MGFTFETQIKTQKYLLVHVNGESKRYVHISYCVKGLLLMCLSIIYIS